MSSTNPIIIVSFPITPPQLTVIVTANQAPAAYSTISTTAQRELNHGNTASIRSNHGPEKWTFVSNHCFTS
jgi:hypothetical protein